MLGVDVPARQPVGLAGREVTHEPRRQLRRSPGRVVTELIRHLRPHQTGADHEDGDAPAELGGERLAVAPDGGLARRVRRAGRAGEVRGAAARDHDPAAATLEHPGNDLPTAEVDAEHVGLEHAPPRLRLDLPGALLPDGHAGVGDEQVDRPQRLLRLGHHALHVRAATHVRGDGEAVHAAAVSSTWSRERAETATRIPAAASSRAMPAPTPRPPPVTSATWPARLPFTRTRIDAVVVVLGRRRACRRRSSCTATLRCARPILASTGLRRM